MKEDQHQKPVKLKCEGCGVEAEFNSAEEAFHAGWDCPPRFPWRPFQQMLGACANSALIRRPSPAVCETGWAQNSHRPLTFAGMVATGERCWASTTAS